MENRYSVTWGKKNWLWPNTDVHCWKHLHKEGNGPSSCRQVSQLTSEKKLIIQAGGNCGMVPYEYSKFFDRVVTFEPDPKNFACLIANHSSKRLTAIQGCLSSKGGELVPMRNNGKNVGACHITNITPTFYALSFTIDSLHLAPNVIHLDVEGHELEVLEGSRKTLEAHKPVIVSEIKPDKRFMVWELLREYGYEELGTVSNGDFVYEQKRKINI